MFLGIDVGTSGVKAVIVSETGAVLDQATAALSVSRPQPDWSEQDPIAWWRASKAAVCALDATLRAAVEGIGIAGQMHGAVLLGADDTPLRPAILWNDGRSGAQCADLEARVPTSRTITGNIAMAGFTAPKLLWVREYEPAVFDAIRTVLLPKDYIRLHMTGDKVSDVSDSAGTLWLDVAKRDWSAEMLGACDLSSDQMPRLCEGTDVAGSLRADIAARWGMRRVPVAGGGGDNAAGAVGVGVVGDGDALLSLGTSGVIFVANRVFRPHPARAVHAFCHCLPAMWHQMAVHLQAASCLDWGARLVGAASPADFLALADVVPAGSGPELFLPYLAGERTPHNDPRARGALLGLDIDSDAPRIAAAICEGVAFALADGLDALRDAGTTVDALTVIGGGARGRSWGNTLAAALDTRLVYREGGEVGPALGAARLAQIAVTRADPAAVCVPPLVGHVIEPDRALQTRLLPKLARFRAAYPLVRQLKDLPHVR